MTSPSEEITAAPASGRIPAALVALLLLIGLGIAWLHARQVGAVPHGLYDDEASIGYNAVHLLRHGTDEYGERMPLYFRSWGDYKSPLFVYSVAAVFGVAGVSDHSLRLTGVLWFLLFLAGVWMLARRLFPGSPAVALYAVLAAGLLPWTFVISRIAFECNSWLPLVALGLVFTWDTFERPAAGARHWISAALAAGALALSFYAYSAARLMSPLLLVAIGLFYFRRNTWREAALMIGAMAVAILATVVYELRHPGTVAARFHTVTYLFDPALTLLQKARRAVTYYLRHFSPQFLLLSGDPNHRHSTGHGGEIYLVVAVLAVAGVGACLFAAEWRRRRFLGLAIVGALSSPIAAALTRESIPHALRSLLLALFLLLLSCYGLAFLSARLGPRACPVLWVAVLGVLAAESGLFLSDYFGRYAEASGRYFEFDGVREALTAAAATPRSRVVFSSSIPVEELHWYQVSVPELGDLSVQYGPPAPAPDVCVIYDRKRDARALDAAAMAYQERGLPAAPIGMRCYGAPDRATATPSRSAP